MSKSADDQQRRETLLLIAVIIMMAVNGTAIVIVTPLAVDIAREFNTSVSVVGQLRTAAALVSGMVAPFVGVMSDRLGRRPIMFLGLLSITLFSIGSVLAPSFAVLLAVQAIAGYGIASLLSTGFAVAGDSIAPERRARAVGIISIGPPMAWVVGLPLIGVVGDVFGWRASFIAVPMLFSILGLLILRWVPPSQPKPQASAGRLGALAGFGDVLRNRSARSWIIAELMAYSGWAGTLLYLGAYYITEHDRSTAGTGTWLALTAVTFVIGSLLSHQAASRFGAKRTIFGTSIVSAVLLTSTMIFSPTFIVSLALLMAFGLSQGFRGAAASVLGLQQSPEHQGTMMGFRASVVQLGYVFGGILGGLLLAVGGYSLMGPGMSVVLIAAAGLMVVSVVEQTDPDRQAAKSRSG